MEKRLHVLSLRLTDSEWETLSAEAARLDRSISWIARHRLFRAYRELPALDHVSLDAVAVPGQEISRAE